MKLLVPFFFLLFSSILVSAQSTPTDSKPTQSVVLSEEGSGPVILFDKKEITQAQLAEMDAKSIGDIQILSGEQAKARFGKYEKNGVILVSSTPPADVIQAHEVVKKKPSAPAEQVSRVSEDEVKMSFGKDLNAHVVIDGKPSTMEALQTLNPDQIKSMEVVKGAAAMKKYGDVAKEGAIEVVTKR